MTHPAMQTCRLRDLSIPGACRSRDPRVLDKFNKFTPNILQS